MVARGSGKPARVHFDRLRAARQKTMRSCGGEMGKLFLMGGAACVLGWGNETQKKCLNCALMLCVMHEKIY